MAQGQAQQASSARPRASPGCCRRARRSRPPPCRRSTGARPAKRAGAALEQRVATALGERRGDGRVVGVEVVVPHEDVDAGGVAAADLHAVDRRQRLLDRQVAGEAAWPAPRPARSATARGVRRRSRRSAHRTSRRAIDGGAGPLQLVGVERRPGPSSASTLGGVGVELVEAGGDRRHQLVVVGQGEHAGHAVQQRRRRRRRRPTAAESPRAARAASSPPSSSSAVGVGREGDG